MVQERRGEKLKEDALVHSPGQRTPGNSSCSLHPKHLAQQRASAYLQQAVEQ